MKTNCHAHRYLIMPLINHNERVTVSLNITINICFKSHRSVEKPNGLQTWYQFFSPGSPIHFFSSRASAFKELSTCFYLM